MVGVGADLEPGTLLAAYRSGLFPMPMGGGRRIAWWSPDPRGILPLDGLRVSRSLRQSCRRYEIRVDTAFDAGHARPAPTRAATAAGSTRPWSPPTASCTSWAGPTASRPGTTGGGWSAASTASRSVASSPASPCSTSPATPRRWPWWRLVRAPGGGRRHAARRAVVDPAPGLVGRDRGGPDRSTWSCWPTPCAVRSTPSARPSGPAPTAATLRAAVGQHDSARPGMGPSGHGNASEAARIRCTTSVTGPG